MRLRGGAGSPWASEQAYVVPLRKCRRASLWAKFMPLWGAAALIGTAYGAGWFDGLWKRGSAQAAISAMGAAESFSYCHVGGGRNCVVDGDTIWFGGEKIRIADIDAPETHDYRCAAEKELGDRATRRLHQLLEGGQVALRPVDRDEDRYGRKLRIVMVNGRSVGDTLISEGLARPFAGGRRPWC